MALVIALAQPVGHAKQADPKTESAHGSAPPAQQAKPQAPVPAHQPVPIGGGQQQPKPTRDGNPAKEKTIQLWGWEWKLADLLNFGIAVATLATFAATAFAVLMAGIANLIAFHAASESARLATHQVELARFDLRPWMTARRIGDMPNAPAFTLAPETWLTVQFEIANVGRSPAHAVRLYGRLFPAPQLPETFPQLDQGPKRVGAGANRYPYGQTDVQAGT